MKKIIVEILICMLVIAFGSAIGTIDHSQESNTIPVAVSEPLSAMQLYRLQAPIVQPADSSSSNYQKSIDVGTDTQITDFIQADSHPWVDIDNNGNPMVVYDHDTGLGYHEIYLQRSLDGGKTWPTDQRYYLAGNVSKSAINPTIEIVDNGTRAEVSFQVEQQPDPTYYRADLVNINDPNTWVLAPSYLDVNYSTSCEETTIDIVGNRNFIISYISDCPIVSCNDSWFVIGATDMDNYSTYSGLFWYYTGSNCLYSHPTVAAGTHELFAAVQFTFPTGDEIGITWCQKDNLTFENWKSYQILRPGYHITNPDIVASGQYAYLAVQTDEKGNNDILCYTPTTGTTWKKNVVVNSSDDEMFPSITATGKTVLCTFVKNNNLYLTKSTDSGATWDAPEQINDPTGQIIGEYRCNNVEGQYSVWMDNRNGNADLYTDTIIMPWLALKKCKGGLGCSVEIANVGTGDATDIPWTMHVSGGQKGLINKTINGTISIAAGKSGKVKSGLFIGFGSILITSTIGGSIIDKEGKHFLIFSIVK